MSCLGSISCALIIPWHFKHEKKRRYVLVFAIYLGQLYSATTSTFINESLFDPKLLEFSKPEKILEVNYTYEEVNSIQKRASTLKASAELCVSIKSGTVKVEGYGSYLDRKEDSSETQTISVMTRVRTRTERLDVVDNRKALRMIKDQVLVIRRWRRSRGKTFR
ncbi:hypothetical protein AX15_002023 [Amanita polypyramis BW_CC]|nr:hypothetical protein AX15_002023 [Amanita polypyramis BW_CC]